jgi:signal transduction histidine kinase
MNLLVNAIQAIAGSGTIRIRIGVEGAQVRVEIEDTGSGIAPEHLARIFDPGFTTKGVGVGTGLGLPICHQIVTAHAGTISVTSQPGVGSTFSVRLPLVTS